MKLEGLDRLDEPDDRCISGVTVIGAMLQSRMPQIEVWMASKRLDVPEETLKALMDHYQRRLLSAPDDGNKELL